jgi:hypothetical protein
MPTEVTWAWLALAASKVEMQAKRVKILDEGVMGFLS